MAVARSALTPSIGNRLVTTVKRAVYLAGGKRPMSTGYGVYKEDRIAEILAAGGFDPERLGPGYGLGLDERVVEHPWLFSRLPPGRGACSMRGQCSTSTTC
jgi:hypothetical protein